MDDAGTPTRRQPAWRSTLAGSHDVIVPQFVAVPEYLDRLADLAAEIGVQHHEFLLITDVASAERRFHQRLGDPLWTEHQRVAASFIAGAGGYRHQYQRLVSGLAGRPVTEIASAEGDVDGTYAVMLATLDASTGR